MVSVGRQAPTRYEAGKHAPNADACRDPHPITILSQTTNIPAA